MTPGPEDLTLPLTRHEALQVADLLLGRAKQHAERSKELRRADQVHEATWELDQMDDLLAIAGRLLRAITRQVGF